MMEGEYGNGKGSEVMEGEWGYKAGHRVVIKVISLIMSDNRRNSDRSPTLTPPRKLPKRWLDKKKGSGKTQTLTSFGFQKGLTPQNKEKARAEIKLAAFAEHNIAYSVADHLADLLKEVVTDSKLIKEIELKRTKLQEILLRYLQREYVMRQNLGEINPESQQHQLHDAALYLGVKVYELLKHPDVIRNPADITVLLMLQNFYKAAATEIKKYNMEDPVLSKLLVLNLHQRLP
ncbi:hypothetical protein EVAR_87851_1 [Eumeta japonica]|uniref:Uncharacterized protein n=1 Tax=Eumeta variegata TaxID=151549 RepID=A0A4C1WX79_EUMVA|nr:hypothetical protein EVAR_87851_1 [Eumeta japonica]